MLKGAGIMSENKSYSYIYNTDGLPILSTFHKWINVPYWHLIPAFFIVVAFFCLLSIPFTRAVNFDSNGGISKTQRRFCTIGCDVKLPGTAFSRENYTLIGWSTAPDGEVQYLPDATISVGKKNMRLYAIWSKNT